MSNRSKGVIALLLAATLYSFYGVFIRQMAHDFSNAAQVGARAGVALIIVLTIIGLKRNWSMPASERWLLLAFGVVNTLYPLMITISTGRIKASNTVLMLYGGGIVTAFLVGTVFLKEKVDFKKLFGICLALIGLAVFAYPYNLGAVALGGIVAGLFAGFFDAAGNSLRKYIKKTPREVLLATSFLTTVIIMGTFASQSSEAALRPPFEIPTIVAVIVHAICLVAVGYLLIYAFKHIDVNIGTVILASEIFIALTVNYFLLHESPSLQELVGAIIIFCAATVAAILESGWFNRLEELR
jgi:drug/metabolite transporter (DMT)-like permease